MEPRDQAGRVYKLLIEAYGRPEWRNPLPPLDELVSTILSQNTNDANRDRAFNSLRARFASWEAVRDADPEAVIAAIRPAGLANQKGPRIQQALREITRQRGELSLDFLSEMSTAEAHAWLTALHGVGPKTAAIVLLFSLGRPAFPVDTHVHRVSGRLDLRPDKMNADAAHPFLGSLFSEDQYYAAHLNLIRLGREVCQARRPNCPVCPLQEMCPTFAAIGADIRDGLP